MVSYSNLAHYYRNTFILMQYHKYSLTDIENMLPYERDLYVVMLNEAIEKENKNG